MSKGLAETRALSILAWLAGHDELFPVFLGTTGANESDLRNRAGEPDFLASVLDFVLMNDDWVLACAADLGIAAEEMPAIRAALPGGQLPNWT